MFGSAFKQNVFLEVSLVVNQHGSWSAKRAGTVLLPGADGRHDSRPEACSQLALREVRCHALERSIRTENVPPPTGTGHSHW